MARSRFVGDRGLTARMTLVMFLLGALFVALITVLMTIFWSGGNQGIAVIIGIAGLGVAWWQWFSSDKLAMRAMRAREVTPEQAPELHGMIDRLNELDTVLEGVVEAGDEMAFPAALNQLLEGVRTVGVAHPSDSLDESDLILPPADATIAEVREMLSEDGLIPG